MLLLNAFKLLQSMTLDPDNLELTMGTEDEISEDEENLKRLVNFM